jgi:hypothetical protein
LIPVEHHHDYLYDDLEGLMARLRFAVRHIDQIRAGSLQQFMGGFDWQHMACRYDDLLEGMVTGRSGEISWPEV